jgi:catechol 2,3-dioxygenase-like lactoylglutathione lyase family enzyme
MDLGAFSVSLSVSDIGASREFYEKLGFEPVGGNADDNWLILRNGEHVIGLFQGMFEKNLMTFNPGWDQRSNETESFMDVREIQQKLQEQGVELASEADETSEGPASIMLTDPDGNPILIDQHR